MATKTFTAIIHKEEDIYFAECPEVGKRWARLARVEVLNPLSLISEKQQSFI